MDKLPRRLKQAMDAYVLHRCERERAEEQVRAAASPAAGPGLQQGQAASPAAGRGGGLAPDDASPAAPTSTAAGGDPGTPCMTQLHLRDGAFLSPPPRRSESTGRRPPTLPPSLPPPVVEGRSLRRLIEFVFFVFKYQDLFYIGVYHHKNY